MKKLLIKWLDKLIYGWGDTMPSAREDDPNTWDSMQIELKELKKLRAWAYSLSSHEGKNGVLRKIQN